IIDSEAELVRTIFRRYAELGSVRLLKGELEAQGSTRKSWKSAAGRRQAVLARGALPDVAQPHLSRRDCSQGPILSWRTSADHRSAAVGCGAGAARRQYHRAHLRHPHSPTKPARRDAV